MCNVRMIRTEPSLVFIPLDKAIYCQNCRMVSSSACSRCGLCGSERIVELATLFTGPWEPNPAPAMAMAA
jgi:hypothetical protein